MAKPRFTITRAKGMPVSNDELIEDLKQTAIQLGKRSIGQKEYRQIGKYDDSTITRRFGSWNEALRVAGLDVSNEIGIPDEQLYENILNLWTHFGRQPRRSELAGPPSQISQSPYNRRFGSWGKALESFVEYANLTGNDSVSGNTTVTPSVPEKRTPRDPSLRLRFRVMQRDRFACCSCGVSPASKPGTELHLDHILPWSRGGETVIENLQTLCSRCNLGKSNLI